MKSSIRKPRLKSKRLNSAVDAFSAEMKARLAEMEKMGYTGWDGEDPDDASLWIGIAGDLYRFKKTVDIANRAMMLWYRDLLRKPVEKP